MNTYSAEPTRTWRLPSTGPLAVLLAIVVLAVGTWLILRPSPDGVLTAADVEGDWPFAAAQVDVECRATAAVAVVDGTSYALSSELRSAPDLATFDLDTDASVWVDRSNGTKVPLQPAINAAEDLCR